MALVNKKQIQMQFWDHVLSCLKMPAGGVNGRGSMHCEFEFVAGSEEIVQFIMEDLPLQANHRYNCSLPPHHWESSPSISTYHAMDLHTIDSYFRLHRRLAAKGRRGYRGSVLAAPPDTHPEPVCLLSAAPPFLAELCHRKHNKLVLAVSFNLVIENDANLQTISPVVQYAQGMDVLLKNRSLNHLKKLHARKEPMSRGFQAMVAGWVSTLSDSEGEWVAPPSDMSRLCLPPRVGIMTMAVGWRPC